MTVNVPRLFANNLSNSDQKSEVFLTWSEFKACVFAWVFLFVCLPATNPAQFNSLWPIWVATLCTKLSLVVGINLATNPAQFNFLWQNWVAIPPLILPPIWSLVFLPALAINPDVNPAVVYRPAQLLPSTLMSIFLPSIQLPTSLSNSYRHHLRQQPRRWFWKRNQSAVLLPTSLIKAAKVISNASKFADQTACNFDVGMLP